jgi:hypothetical protein
MSSKICLRCDRSGEGSLILLQYGQLSSVRAGGVSPLTLPPGAPRPAGPLPRTASSSGDTGSAS